MSNAHRSVKYPKALLLLPQEEWFTEQDIADKLEVSNRTVYRWYTQGYLKREIKDKLTVYMINDKKRPSIIVRTSNQIKPTNNYTVAQLEQIYQEIMDGTREAKIDIGSQVRQEADLDTMIRVLKGVEQFHEFVSFVIEKKR